MLRLDDRKFEWNTIVFELKQIELSPEIKEGVVTVAVEAYVCEECGTPLMTDKQMNAFRKAGADKYREKQGAFPFSG